VHSSLLDAGDRALLDQSTKTIALDRHFTIAGFELLGLP